MNTKIYIKKKVFLFKKMEHVTYIAIGLIASCVSIITCFRLQTSESDVCRH